MNSELRERLARLGPIRAVDRVSSGSPAVLMIRVVKGVNFNSITATLALARRGMSLLRAKRAIEAALDHEETPVHVPTVESLEALSTELEESGFIATQIVVDAVDVKALRDKLGLSQEQFALRYGLDADTVQNWEQGRSRPDRASSSYLRVIAALPREAGTALERPMRNG